MQGRFLIQSNLKLLIAFFILSGSAYCQIENLKWGKVDFSYEKKSEFRKRDYSFQADNAGQFFKKSLVNTYWFFISDVDGDNCPFRPSCSSFFVDASEETNIFQGSLMFADRLIRDLNPVKANHYPKEKSGHYFDPAFNYTLAKTQIIYLPSEFIIDDE